MTKPKLIRQFAAAALVIVMSCVSFGAVAKGNKAAAICKDPALPYNQQYICQQEFEGAKTKHDQDVVVKRFTERAKAAQKPKKN